MIFRTIDDGSKLIIVLCFNDDEVVSISQSYVFSLKQDREADVISVSIG